MSFWCKIQFCYKVIHNLFLYRGQTGINKKVFMQDHIFSSHQTTSACDSQVKGAVSLVKQIYFFQGVVWLYDLRFGDPKEKINV